MSELTITARELKIHDRTLRRGLATGLVRGHRISPRKALLDPAERAYLRSHWPLLGQLRQALRTERNVRLAVLFGSQARGDDGPGSDVDLLVDLRDASFAHIGGLRQRLTQALGREVEIIPLSTARRQPLMLKAVLDEGRVLIDRDAHWQRLQVESDAIRAAAKQRARENAKLARRALTLLRNRG